MTCHYNTKICSFCLLSLLVCVVMILSGCVRNGPYIKWHKNGQKKSERIYKDGKLHGPRIVWNENGQKMTEAFYKNGQRTSMNEWNYYENGQKKSVANFKDGKKHGPHIEWHKNGQKKSERIYKDGKLNGPRSEWSENGQKMTEINFKDGKEHGPWIEWNENGQKEREHIYKDGKLVDIRSVADELRNQRESSSSHTEPTQRRRERCASNAQSASSSYEFAEYQVGMCTALGGRWYPQVSRCHFSSSDSASRWNRFPNVVLGRRCFISRCENIGQYRCGFYEVGN